jgi:outer membrane protein, multidrug efflux system
VFFPQINLTGLYGVDALQLKKLFDKDYTTWVIGGSLLQQIFTGGRLFAQLKIAKAVQQEMVYQYQQTILTALKEVDNALIGLEKSKEIVVAGRKEVAALQDYLKLAWYRYYEGETQYLTVLDAQRKVFSAELALAGYIANQFQFLVDLYKSLGGGWVIQSDMQAVKEAKIN